MSIVVALVVAVLGVACSSSEGASGGGGTSGGTLTISMAEDVMSLDPHSISGYGAMLWPLMYDTLVHVGADGEIQSGLAESWDVSDDGTVYEFTLRDDATCADGTPVTPSLVARNFERVKDPSHPAGELVAADPAGYQVTADDETSVLTLTLTEPDPFELESLTQLFIACERGLDDPAAFDSGDGSGPFEMVDMTPGVQYRFRARPGYSWGPDGASTDVAGFPSEVVARIVADESTRANMLLAGDLDVAQFSGPEHERVEAAGSIETQPVNGTAMTLVFNQGSGHVTADDAVRRALAAAVDWDDYTQVLTGGLGERPEAVAMREPRACPYDLRSAMPEVDVEAANELLDDAGWVAGSDGVRQKDGRDLAVTVVGLSSEQSAFELLQASWAEIGVRTTLDLVGDPGAVTEKTRGGDDWDMTSVRADHFMPEQIWPMLVGPPPPEGRNFGHVDNPEYAEASAEALVAPRDEACELWKEAEALAYESADVVPTALTINLWAHRSGTSLEPRGGATFVPTSLRTS